MIHLIKTEGCHSVKAGKPWSLLITQSVFEISLFVSSAFCFQSIAKNRNHWSSQTLDDNVLMVRFIQSSKKCNWKNVKVNVNVGHLVQNRCISTF